MKVRRQENSSTLMFGTVMGAGPVEKKIVKLMVFVGVRGRDCVLEKRFLVVASGKSGAVF